MGGADIRARAFQFGCRSIELSEKLYQTGGVARFVVPQLLRAGTSVGANLEEAYAGQSKADFIAKTSIALKEAREAKYWRRLVDARHLLPHVDLNPDIQE